MTALVCMTEEEHSLTGGIVRSRQQSRLDGTTDTIHSMTSVVCSGDYEDDTSSTMPFSSTSSSSSMQSTTTSSSLTSKCEQQEEEDEASFDTIYTAVQDEPSKQKTKEDALSLFTLFRIQYLIVHTAIMLADGLQGTHLYVLYEGYGYSVSSLYSLGFVAGAFTSPFIGPVVDKIGRKKAAILYCVLEMIINYLELFPIFAGLIVSRMIGGITTNLLFSVFESWLVSEHRSRGFEQEKLEIILRDSTIVSNSAAIFSGYLAHCLAANLGAAGPFQGAVVLTCVALILVWAMWTENYGTGSNSSEITTWRGNMAGAFNTIVKDSKISRIGLIQGLTEGSLQTFVFLWSPALRTFANNAPAGSLGLDTDGEPAYGLIFGAFMACGVLGGFTEPLFRNLIKKFTVTKKKANADDTDSEGENGKHSVDFLCTICYLVSALLFLIPVFAKKDGAHSFTMCFGAFLIYELMVGLYMPCEGVIRSIYMPNESICSVMTMLRVVVNVAVALGVVSTNYVSFTSAFAALSVMMVVAAGLQLSLVPRDDLAKVFGNFVCTTFGASNGKKVKVA